MTEIAPVSKEASTKISNMSFVYACLVVVIHIVHPHSGLSGILDKMLAGGVAKIAVPTFFCISGYLLAPKMVIGNYRLEIRKRIKTLVVPFLIWGLLGVLATFPLALLADIRQQLPIGTSFCKGKQLGEMIVGWLGLDLTRMPLSGPLWFLRNLFLLVIISPCIYMLIKRFQWYWVTILFCILCVYNLFEPTLPEYVNGFLHYGFSLSGIAAFSLGMNLRLHGSLNLPRRFAFISLIIGIVLWSILTFCYRSPLVLTVMIVFLGYSIWYFMPVRSLPTRLTQSSFPIYLMHTIFLGYLQSFPSIIPGPGTIIGFFIHWIVPIVLSVFCSVVMHKYCPRVSSLIFGGR